MLGFFGNKLSLITKPQMHRARYSAHLGLYKYKFCLTQVYKVMGKNHLATMNFSRALDLDPKGANNHIKEAINKQQGDDTMLARLSVDEGILSHFIK